MFVKILIGFAAMAALETLNGIFRMRYLHKNFGRKTALKLSFLIGSLLVIALNLTLYPWIAPRNFLDAVMIGLTWALLMGTYDIVIGRFAFKASWETIAGDFDPRQGNWLSFGMVLIMILPPLIFAMGR